MPKYTSVIVGKNKCWVVVSTPVEKNHQIGSFNPGLTTVAMFTTEQFIIFQPQKSMNLLHSNTLIHILFA